jgi:hypothetical protein
MDEKAMAVKTAANRRLTEELLEMANDMRESGVMSKAAHDRIIKRLIIPARSKTSEPQ